MVVAEKDWEYRYKGRTEIYKRIKLPRGSKKAIPRNSISGNRSKCNSKCNHNGAHRGKDKNLRSGQDVKLLPHEGYYSQPLRRSWRQIAISLMDPVAGVF